MPRVSLQTTFNNSLNDLAILRNYINDSKTLDAKYQHIISEIIMLRLFSILEHSICEIAFKLACGAKYRNGNSPSIHLICSSIQDANAKMLVYGRRNPLRYHRWTTENYIKISIENILDIHDSFFSQIQIHSSIINEMRIVRNHIAHKSTNTRNAYFDLLTTIYGGNPRIVAGAFLSSTTRHTRSNIERYFLSINVILNDITNG